MSETWITQPWVAEKPGEVTHACPVGDGGITPCCGRTPFELPMFDRLTADPSLVTCPEVREGGSPQ